MTYNFKEFITLTTRGTENMLDKIKMWMADFNDVIENIPVWLKCAAFFILGLIIGTL
jgi:hypothetical protein